MSTLTLRVYYEDTDAGGIVYYANYLRFLERARTEVLRELGHSQHEWLAQGVAFVVHRVEADYRLPARLDDLLTVHTQIASLGRAQLMFSQCIRRDDVVLLDAKIRLACIDPVAGKPRVIPADMHRQFYSLMETSE
jgi:acyl-CoA thioester hydrolase